MLLDLVNIIKSSECVSEDAGLYKVSYSKHTHYVLGQYTQIEILDSRSVDSIEYTLSMSAQPSQVVFFDIKEMFKAFAYKTISIDELVVLNFPPLHNAALIVDACSSLTDAAKKIVNIFKVIQVLRRFRDYDAPDKSVVIFAGHPTIQFNLLFDYKKFDDIDNQALHELVEFLTSKDNDRAIQVVVKEYFIKTYSNNQTQNILTDFLLSAKKALDHFNRNLHLYYNGLSMDKIAAELTKTNSDLIYKANDILSSIVTKLTAAILAVAVLFEKAEINKYLPTYLFVLTLLLCYMIFDSKKSLNMVYSLLHAKEEQYKDTGSLETKYKESLKRLQHNQNILCWLLFIIGIIGIGSLICAFSSSFKAFIFQY